MTTSKSNFKDFLSADYLDQYAPKLEVNPTTKENDPIKDMINMYMKLGIEDQMVNQSFIDLFTDDTTVFTDYITDAFDYNE